MIQRYQTLKKYFTNSDYNEFTNDILDENIKEKVNESNESNTFGFIDKWGVEKEIPILEANAELKYIKIK